MGLGRELLGVAAQLLAQPAVLRLRLQRGVIRLLYGLREEPYVPLARLGMRLEGKGAPDTVLEVIVVPFFGGGGRSQSRLALFFS